MPRNVGAASVICKRNQQLQQKLAADLPGVGTGAPDCTGQAVLLYLRNDGYKDLLKCCFIPRSLSGSLIL